MIQLIALALLSAPAQAQELELPALSPRAEVSQEVGLVEVTVNYASPGKRDRTIWGELVPYDKMWRTGANAATTLEVTGDIEVGGKEVPAGKYSVFTIPGKDEWTVILNKNPDLGGTRNYDEALDQARIQVKPEEAPERERMTFLFSDTDQDSTRLDLEWAGLRVGVPIEVDTKAMVAEQVDAYVDSVGSGLASAARYQADEGKLDQAVKLIDASIALDQTWYNTFLKAEFLHKQGDAKTAYKLAQQAHAMGLEAENFFWKERVEKALAEWKKK